MVEETVWVEKKYVRPRLSPDELWLIYRVPFKETERLLEAGSVHAHKLHNDNEDSMEFYVVCYRIFSINATEANKLLRDRAVWHGWLLQHYDSE